MDQRSKAPFQSNGTAKCVKVFKVSAIFDTTSTQGSWLLLIPPWQQPSWKASHNRPSPDWKSVVLKHFLHYATHNNAKYFICHGCWRSLARPRVGTSRAAWPVCQETLYCGHLAGRVTGDESGLDTAGNTQHIYTVKHVHLKARRQIQKLNKFDRNVRNFFFFFLLFYNLPHRLQFRNCKLETAY